MANHLGTVKDMEQYKQQIQKQQRQFKKAKKDFLRYFPKEKAEVIEIEHESILEIKKQEQEIIEKPKRERKLSPRELQMNRPIFNTDYEKYEWLMANGTTNPEDRSWLTNYIRSDEYINIYGD